MSTYGCRPVGEQRCCPVVGSAEHPDLVGRSLERQGVPEAAAFQHDDWKDTCCAATRSSIQNVWELVLQTEWAGAPEEHGEAVEEVLPSSSNEM